MFCNCFLHCKKHFGKSNKLKKNEKQQFVDIQITIILRERPFNLKGGGGCFFFLKKYSDSQYCWKKYSDFGGGKKKYSDSEFLSYNLMLDSGKKNSRQKN
jgi:hypothetical protein